MSMTLGRLPRTFASTSSRMMGAAGALALFACSPEPAASNPLAPSAVSAARADTAAPNLAAAPATLAFRVSLDGVEYQLALEQAPPPTSAGYQSYRLRRDGSLVPMGEPSEAACSYRGRAQPVLADSATAAAGFVSVSVCPSATGLPLGQALSGVLRAGDRFWRLWPDAADTHAADGVDHWVVPVQRKDTPDAVPAAAQLSTVFRAAESPALQLKFREGTEAETKYIELLLVSDAARVAELGGQTEAVGLRFVDTMNALLEGSGLVPRLRVTLRAQVLFDADPYAPEFDGNEVDHDSLINEFLGWANGEALPPHDEHVLLSGLDFLGGTVGYAGVQAACTARQNGFIVEAGDSGGGFAALSAVHELGHTVGMNHDDGVSCSRTDFIMAAVGCANCQRDNQFSSCSVQQFAEYLAGPAYAEGGLCADDVPSGVGVATCGDAAVQAGETCDCGATDCSDIDPCCNGATCQLESDAQCSDFNDECCRGCAIVSADARVVCRAPRSECDVEELCTGGSKSCPADTFDAAGQDCEDERGNAGVCYFGDCRSRATQCEQIAEQQGGDDFANIGAPGPNCAAACDRVICGGMNSCVTITGPTVSDGVPCGEGGQCVAQACVALVDQCPADTTKNEPGACGCGSPDDDGDADGAPDCVDVCPEDAQKQSPGACGCGTPDTDGDADGTPDCTDGCVTDATKQTPGSCGCGAPDADTDGDGTADCNDACPDDAASVVAGACGCGVPATDTDGDGTADCNDACAEDPNRIAAPCARSSRDDNDAEEASVRASASGSCAVGRTPRPTHPAWLLIAALPLLRRRSASPRSWRRR